MKLNADIVFDNLPENLHASMTGPKEFSLALKRPELYAGGNRPFEENRLYVVHADRIPQSAHTQRGCVIISIGDSLRLERYRKRCTVIAVSPDADFYETFNIVQNIFDSYDAWEDELSQIIGEDADISRLLTCSERIFGNPLFAIDADFRILGFSRLAATLEANPVANPVSGGSLRLDAFDQFLELHDLSMDEHEPLVLELLDQTTLNCNLFEADEYQGCVTVHYSQRTYRPSDKPLIAFLADKLLAAMRQLAAHSPEGLGSLRQALQNLVEERPLDSIERSVVADASSNHRYICMRMKLSNQLEQLPLGYVRNTVEGAFPHSIVFEYHRNSVIAIIDIDALGNTDYHAEIARCIEPFTRTMEMKAGLSNPSDDLLNARALFLQANAALDLGILFAPDESVFAFDDFALRKMTMDAVGEMPLNLLVPEGLRRLIEHDRSSSTSYVETLRTYLNCNMGVAKTAAALYVHRSTLLERLGRIKRELAIDLDDPDEQLRLRLLLKAMQTRDDLRLRRKENA